MAIEVAVPDPAPDTRIVERADSDGWRPQWLKVAVVTLAIASVAWAIAYLALAVPGSWFSSAPVLHFSGAQMKITRGAGFFDGTKFIVRATDPSELAIVTIDTPNVQ